MGRLKLKMGHFFRFLVCLSLVLICFSVISGCDDDDDNDALTQNLTTKEKSYLSSGEVDQADTLTSKELTGEGFDSLNAQTSQGVLKAKSYFKLADLKSSDNSTKFLRAASGVAAIGFDLEMDGSTGELKDLGDVVEALGGTTVTGAWDQMEIILPEELPESTPDVQEFLDFYEDVVVVEIEAALSLLDDITTAFNYAWVEPISNNTVESDYGDVLFGKALLKANLGFYYFLKAYNLELAYDDISPLVNEQTTVEQFLNANASLLTLGSRDSIDKSKSYFVQAADDLLEAINWMEMEADVQDDDLVSLSDMSNEDINDAKEIITGVRDSIENGQIITIDNDEEAGFGTRIVLEPLFDGLNLRALLPEFTGNNAVGFLPDPTFGGILESIEGADPVVLNNDVDGSGTADIFE